MDAASRLDVEQLLAEARAGRRDSLGALLDIYRSYLHALARSQLKGRLRARLNPSDLVQETFLRASRRFDNFHGTNEQEWLGWLRAILRRCLLRAVQEQVQTGKRSILREVRFGGGPESPSGSCSRQEQCPAISPGSSPSTAALRREAAGDLARRLEHLPAPLREVLVLRNLDGLPFNEVARRMGRSPGAVRVLWLRALDRLRQQSQNEEAS
jgi:RNA polymerase sigma-70 factor (ECF subfamily)